MLVIVYQWSLKITRDVVRDGSFKLIGLICAIVRDCSDSRIEWIRQRCAPEVKNLSLLILYQENACKM